MKLFSKTHENLRKMLRKFKETLRYSLIWKEKKLSSLTSKKSYSVPSKVRQNRVERDVAGVW